MTTAKERREYISHLRNEIQRLKRINEVTSNQIDHLTHEIIDLEQKYSWRERDIEILSQRLDEEIGLLEAAGIKVYPEGYDPDDDGEEFC